MNDSFTVFAHRGASGYVTENTIESFTRAIELGATWIECDARAVEGRAIIFHDRNLNRMSGVNQLVAKQSLSQLQSIELKGGGRIPLLERVIQVVDGRAGLQIELKGTGAASVVATDLKRALSAGLGAERLLVSSFDHQELYRFKQMIPEVRLGLLVYGYPLNCLGIARRLGVFSVHLNVEYVTAERVNQLKKAGYKVYVYTVNDSDELKALSALGIDGVFSDFPDRILADYPSAG
jgi:glycerophosphoryl diester phosphodiesterase